MKLRPETPPTEAELNEALAELAAALKVWAQGKGPAEVSAWMTWFQDEVFGQGLVLPFPPGHQHASPFGGAPIDAAIRVIGHELRVSAPGRPEADIAYVMSSVVNFLFMKAEMSQYLTLTPDGLAGGMLDPQTQSHVTAKAEAFLAKRERDDGAKH